MSHATPPTPLTALPVNLEQITREWLSQAMARTNPGVDVASVRVDSVIWGTASKVFLDVTYASNPGGRAPQRLCLKGGFDEKLSGVQGQGYSAEARFYRDIAPALDGVPRCWFADEDAHTGQGLVLTDDLRDVNAVFGSPFDQVSVDDVAASLELMAGWHGRTWGRRDVGSTPWLTVGSQLFRQVAVWFLTPAHWDVYIELPQTAAFTPAMRDRETLARSIRQLWAQDDAGPLAISHGDPHVGNTYTVPGGQRRFLDWQTVCLAPWSDDVTYFMTGALTVADRRAHDAALLKHYLGALRAAIGSAAPTFDEAWLAYRQHQLHGLMFALCPSDMQPAAVCEQMGVRYGAAVTDLETLAAFGR